MYVFLFYVISVVTMIFNEAAIVLFCQELKILGDFTYSNGKKEVTQHMVTGFNHELFSTLISPNSKTHDPSICDFRSIGEHIFKQNEIWINRDLIKSVCDIFANVFVI